MCARVRLLSAGLILFAGAFLPALAGCRAAAWSAGRAVPVTEFRLENGLRVLLRPISGARQTAVVVLFSLGGSHDPEGRSGLGHLLEHLYVTAGAGERPPRAAEEWMARRAGNAQTGERYTVVSELVNPGELEEALAEAADRMRDLRVTEADLRREKPRLLTEVSHMFGGIPPLAAFNLARERVLPNPAGGRRGGLPAHVERLSLDELRERWKRYYRPANALLVLAGDFDAEAVRQAVETAFGPIPGGDPAPEAPAPGKSRPGTEVVSVKPVVPGAASEACLAYAAPLPGSPEYAPFLLLAARLVEAASSAGNAGTPAAIRFPPPVYYAALDAPELLTVSAPLKQGETPEAAVSRLGRLVADTTGRKLGPDDRRRVENQYGAFLGLTSMPDGVWARNPYGLAFSLGRRAQLGMEPGKLKRELAAVTPEQLQQCARIVFAPERRAAVVVTVPPDTPR